MASNTRGRPGRPVPDDMEDDRLEEGATRPALDVSALLSRRTFCVLVNLNQ